MPSFKINSALSTALNLYIIIVYKPIQTTVDAPNIFIRNLPHNIFISQKVLPPTSRVATNIDERRRTQMNYMLAEMFRSCAINHNLFVRQPHQIYVLVFKPFALMGTLPDQIGAVEPANSLNFRFALHVALLIEELIQTGGRGRRLVNDWFNISITKHSNIV